MENRLPKGWGKFNISALLDKNDIFSDGDWIESKDQDPNGDVRLIQLADIGINEFRDKSNRYLTSQKAEELKCTFLKKNDVLIARMPDPIGRSCVFPLEGKFATVVDVAIVRINSKYINPRLLSFFINSIHIQNKIRDLSSGSTRLRISRKNLDTIKFPLPPLPEQERIVAKLDALFAQHEAMKKALERIPQLLKDFRQQVLIHAVTGKFTSNYEYQPIVQEIISDRKEWYKKQLSHAKPKKIIEKVNEDKSFLEFYLEKKTDISFIEEVSAKKDNALKAGPFGSSLKKEFYVQKGYKIYGQEQVIKGDSKYGDYYIDEAKYKELQSCAIDKGDLLISLVGTIGKTLVIPADFEKGIINPRLLKFSFHEKINPYYIQIYLQSEIANKFLSKNSHGGTMDVLNMGILKKLPIPIPSTEEQQEIVNIVENLFSKADAIEKRYKTLKEKIDNLPQAILHKAFKGELSEQLESDGDAKYLLEEIIKLRMQTKKEEGKN